MAFDIHAHSTGAFIKNSICWPVVDESSHCHSLLFSSTEHIVPVILLVPATFSIHKVAKSDFLEELEKVIVILTSSLVVLVGFWIDELISEGTVWQVWSLRNIENLVNVGFMKNTRSNWPKLSHYTEQGTLSATVWSLNEKMHTWLDLKVHLWNQYVSVW